MLCAGGRGGQGERAETEHIGQIVAIGRNYAEHIKELSNDAPKEPMFFLKPTTSYLPSGGNVEIPRGVTAHYEGACILRPASYEVSISSRNQSSLGL